MGGKEQWDEWMGEDQRQAWGTPAALAGKAATAQSADSLLLVTGRLPGGRGARRRRVGGAGGLRAAPFVATGVRPAPMLIAAKGSRASGQRESQCNIQKRERAVQYVHTRCVVHDFPSPPPLRCAAAASLPTGAVTCGLGAHAAVGARGGGRVPVSQPLSPATLVRHWMAGPHGPLSTRPLLCCQAPPPRDASRAGDGPAASQLVRRELLQACA